MSVQAWSGVREVPVLIAGGGLVGLSTATFLAQHGIASLVVERLRGGSPVPRAAHFHLRTLELFRSAGIEDEVKRQSESEFLPEGAIVAMDSLVGRKLADIIPSLNVGVDDALSPCRRLFITQPGLEPILRRRARAAGAEVLEGSEVVAAGQDPDGVTVTINDVDGDDTRTLRARYLVGADGAHSKVRELLGIPFDGRGVFSNSITIYFTADLAVADAGQAAERDLHQQSAVRRLLPPREGLPVRIPGREHGRRSQQQSGRRQRRQGHQRAAPDRVCARRGRRARPAGEDHRAGALARHLGRGAVFSGPAHFPGRRRRASDAAERRLRRQYRHPGRAQSRLEACTRAQGFGRPRLAHDLRHGAAAGRQAHGRAGLHPLCHPHRHLSRGKDFQPLVPDFNIELGYLYRSAAILSENGAGAGHDDPRQTRGGTGSRAPHLWLRREGKRISSLDLFGRSFVLLAGREGAAWCDAARTAAGRFNGLELDARCIGAAGLSDPEGRFAAAYALSASGVALVRPDGFVAWRAEAMQSDPGAALAQALSAVLSE
jgi:2-polyprenyl-6-methoxyphenol hydroxylase-like FAD-dependent oxidoreductase